MATDMNDVVARLNASRPPCVHALGGEAVRYRPEPTELEMRFDMPLEFCHSGNVVQGGFVTGMLDATMAHCVFAHLGGRLALPSLEIKVSFLKPTLAGEQRAVGRIERLGRSIVFLSGDLFDAAGERTATATSTAKVVRLG
jgi:uncharacterized protein (TIGR00369 family)